MKYLSINKNIRMRKENEKWAILFDKRVEKINKNIQFIPINDFLFLQLFDGSLTKNDIINLLIEKFTVDESSANNLVEKCLVLYGKYIEELEVKDKRDDLIVYKAMLYKNKYKFKNSLRLSTPLNVSLIVTDNCYAHCKYCYAKSGNKSTDLLTTENIFKILDECKRLGVSTINLSGGDPFTRNDIFDILNKLIENKFEFSVSTKKILTAEDISNLKKIKLREIQLSIDSDSNEICKELIGLDDYFSKMIKVIQNLKLADINVKVNIVATKKNIRTIPSLVNKLLDLDVSKIYISPYLNSLGRHNDEYLCNEQLHEELASKLPNDIRIDYSKPNYLKQEIKQLNNIQTCSGGKTGLVIYSDGSTGLCERLIKGYINFGNVKSSTILNIWQSEILFSYIEPDMNKFKGTKCYQCEEYETCILKKGICYVRSMMYFHKMFSPDPLCPKTKEKVEIF